MPERTERILIVGPSWVGDMVISQVLYRELVATRPGLAIDVLAPAWSAPLLARMPEVRRTIELPVGHGEVALGRRRRIGHELRATRYHQAIVLPNSFKSALIPWFARIERRTGWRGELRYGLLNDVRQLDKQALPSLAQRFAALGRAARTPAPPELLSPCLQVVREDALAARDQFGINHARPLLALCPGAEFGEAKRWPAERYAAIASAYLNKGWQVILFGSAADAAACAQIASACDHAHCYDLAGVTRLATAIDLLSLADRVLTNDSGLMHVAAALGRPCLAVYGPTSPRFTPPLHTDARVVASDAPCAPCFARQCPLGHHRCMGDLTAPLVQAQLDLLPDPTPYLNEGHP